MKSPAPSVFNRREGRRSVNENGRRLKRPFVNSSECDCVRLMQEKETPDPDGQAESDDVSGLASDQDLMLSIECLLRPGTLAWK